jgi:hypothetical protein
MNSQVNDDNKFQFPIWMGEYPRQNAPWGDKEVDVLVRGFKINRPLVEIAKKHGRQLGGIKSRLSDSINPRILFELQFKRLATRGIYVRGQYEGIIALFDAELLDPNDFRIKYPNTTIEFVPTKQVDNHFNPTDISVDRINSKIEQQILNLERDIYNKAVIDDARYKALNKSIKELRDQYLNRQNWPYDPGI